MQKWFLVVWTLFALGIFMISCSATETQEESINRSKVKNRQWQADSLAARQLMNEMYPDTTKFNDSLAVDSLQTDSLLR